MKSVAFLLPFVLVPSFGPAGGSARPDVIVDSVRRPIWCVTTVEPGSFAWCRTYQIVKGDTFDEIAKRECGDRRCTEEIRLLNPDEKPSKLQPGTRIAIPPRVEAATSRPESRATGTAEADWVVLQYRGGRFIPIIAREALMSGSRHLGSSLVAVKRSKLAWLLRGDWKSLDATEGVACSPPLNDSVFVDKNDPTLRMEKTVTLKGIKDGRLLIDVVDKRFDRRGKLISERASAGTDTLREGGYRFATIDELLGVPPYLT